MKYYIAWAGSALALAVIFALKKPLKDALYEQGRDQTIPDWQDSLSDTGWNIWAIITNMGAGNVQLPLMGVALLAFPHHPQTFLFVLLGSFQAFMMGVLKTGHHDPRPFWENHSIRVVKCYVQFGSPSGHEIFASCYTFYCALLLGRGGTWYKRGLLFIAAAIGSTLMAFSRVILGVHTFDQVIYGALLGIWLAVVFFFQIEPLVRRHLESLKEKTKLGEKLKRECLFALTLALILLAATIITFIIVDSQDTFELDPHHKKGVQACLEDQELELSFVKRKNYRFDGFSIFWLGAYLGTAYRLQSTASDASTKVANWKVASLRIFASVIAFGIYMGFSLVGLSAVPRSVFMYGITSSCLSFFLTSGLDLRLLSPASEKAEKKVSEVETV